MKTGMRKKVSITISSDLIKWLDLQVKKKKFASRSEGLEYAINRVRKGKILS